MKTQTIIVRAGNHQENDPQTIVLGRRGSYGTKRVQFDCAAVLNTFPEIASVELWLRLPGADLRHFTLPLNGSVVVWEISETDTFRTGGGESQLFFHTDSDGIWKSNIFPVTVLRDINR